MGPNETVLREVYKRFSAGDSEYLYSILADDVVWRSSGNPAVLPFAGERHGKEGVREYFKTSRADWDVQRHEPVEFLSAGDDKRFAVRVAIDAVNRITNGRVRMEKVDLITMQDRKCTSYVEVFDSALTERAAGHSPGEPSS
jgi:ketosteroid isomerase-like protein